MFPEACEEYWKYHEYGEEHYTQSYSAFPLFYYAWWISNHPFSHHKYPMSGHASGKLSNPLPITSQAEGLSILESGEY